MECKYDTNKNIRNQNQPNIVLKLLKDDLPDMEETILDSILIQESMIHSDLSLNTSNNHNKTKNHECNKTKDIANDKTDGYKRNIGNFEARITEKSTPLNSDWPNSPEEISDCINDMVKDLEVLIESLNNQPMPRVRSNIHTIHHNPEITSPGNSRSLEKMLNEYIATENVHYVKELLDIILCASFVSSSEDVDSITSDSKFVSLEACTQDVCNNMSKTSQRSVVEINIECCTPNSENNISISDNNITNIRVLKESYTVLCNMQDENNKVTDKSNNENILINDSIENFVNNQNINCHRCAKNIDVQISENNKSQLNCYNSADNLINFNALLKCNRDAAKINSDNPKDAALQKGQLNYCISLENLIVKKKPFINCNCDKSNDATNQKVQLNHFKSTDQNRLLVDKDCVPESFSKLESESILEVRRLIAMLEDADCDWDEGENQNDETGDMKMSKKLDRKCISNLRSKGMHFLDAFINNDIVQGIGFLIVHYSIKHWKLRCMKII